MTYPSAVSTRSQTPAHRAREAVKVLGEQHAVELNRHEKQLRDRLVNGDTNGTRNDHQIANVLRFTKGGRATFIGHIERAMRNGDPDARAWWLIYGDLLPAQQIRADIDDICEAAGVPPDRIMAVAVSSAMRFGTDAADYVAAVMHPKIVHQTVKSALRIGGDYASVAQRDREMLLGHAKFLPSKSTGPTVNVNATAQAAANAAAASSPSVPTFAESLRGSTQARLEVQRQIADTSVITVDPVESE